jgi:opine dehydrogenase
MAAEQRFFDTVRQIYSDADRDAILKRLEKQHGRKLKVTMLTTGNSACGQTVRLIAGAIADVTMWADPNHKTTFNAIRRHGLKSTGDIVTHVHPAMTLDLYDALDNADIVIFASPVHAQEDLITQCLEHNVRDQLWMSIHAVGFASVAKTMFQGDNRPRAIFDVNTSLDACRVQIGADGVPSVNIVEPKSELKVAGVRTDLTDPPSQDTVRTLGAFMRDALPLIAERDSDIAVAVLPGVPKIVFLQSELYLLFVSSAHLLHVIPSMFNIAPLTDDKFRTQTDYYPDCVGNQWAEKVMMALDADRVRTAKRLGFDVNTLLQGVSADRGIPFKNMVEYGKSRPMGPEFLPRFNGNYTVQELLTNFVPIIAIMEVLGEDTTNYMTVLNIGNMFFDRDFMEEGRNAKKLGIEGMTAEQLIAKYGI